MCHLDRTQNVSHLSGMTTVSEIVERISRPLLGEMLGVKRQAITNAVSDRRFPAKWFSVIHDLCAERGIDCPRELFAFVAPPSTDDHSETSSQTRQDSAA